jgi:hypothetical protein
MKNNTCKLLGFIEMLIGTFLMVSSLILLIVGLTKARHDGVNATITQHQEQVYYSQD